jgi:hypothetical protein
MTRRIFLYGGGVAFVAVAVFSLISSLLAAQDGASSANSAQRTQTSVSTPRTPDGHPDLSGVWNGAGGGGGGSVKPDENGNLTYLAATRPCHPGQECLPGVNFERDGSLRARMSPNRPWYKPHFWAKVQYNDEHVNTEDPGFSCRGLGIPRMGPPSKIVQTPTEVIFLYVGGEASTTQDNFRVLPIDGRQHDPIRSQDQTPKGGDPVGHWEGETLVVDTVGFSDDTWLSTLGYFHSNNMRVIERLRREGNTLTWQPTVDDPDVLMKPWLMDPRTLRLNPNPKALLTETLPCEELDRAHMVTREHH